MHQIKIRLLHKDCWCAETTAKSPGIKLIHTGYFVVLKRRGNSYTAQTTWKVISKNERGLIKYLKILKKHPKVDSVEIIKMVGSRALIFVKYGMKYSQFDIALREGAIPAEPVEIENGIEYHSFLTEDSKIMKKLLKKIRNDEDVTIVSLGKPKKSKEKFSLTFKQKEALRLALMYDYYHWPRKITLNELSKIAKLSRKVYQDHLRKAESKLFPQLALDKIID